MAKKTTTGDKAAAGGEKAELPSPAQAGLADAGAGSAKAGAPAADKPAEGAEGKAPAFSLTASRHFNAWLAQQGASLAFTTYQAGKLFLIGVKQDGRLSVEERTLQRCMGIAAHGTSLWVSTLYQVWRFENALPDGQSQQGYDRVYVPRMSFVTGDVDVHEMAVDGDGHVVFVNTLFSCLARLSPRYSFEPVWRPPFVSDLGPEDRCHLSGLAMVEGKPRYATSVSASDVADGWRDKRVDGGCLVDVETNEIVVGGLSMPHSPRWHAGKLWLLDSGSGYFGYADLDSKKFVPTAFCPGYARGMAMHGSFAVVGVSKGREQHSFGGLALEKNLKEKNAEPRCGLLVVELATGNVLHWLRLEGVVEELFDVAVLPGAIRPRAVGFVTDEVRRTISLPPEPGRG